jgi:dolichol-phosphate mannosyltransferase
MTASPLISVVIPTYKECLNIPLIAQAIRDCLSNVHFEIIFVDDDSQDGSAAAVEALQDNMPVSIIVRTGVRGLSTAVIEGIVNARGKYVVVMDADLSHPASAILDIIALLQSGNADFVIGSRYVDGGSFDENWGLFRLLNSKLATWLAMPLCHVKDPMSGFFAFERENMPPIHKLSPVGYKIGLEILVKGEFSQPSEVPIHFVDRQHGESKLDFKEQIRYLKHLRRLYQYKYTTLAEFIQFGIVGSTGFIVDTIVYFSLQFLFGLGHLNARALSFWPAVTWNWYFNRVVTFTNSDRKKKLKQWLSFSVTSLFGFAVNVGSYRLLTDFVPFFVEHKFMAFIVGVALGMGFNFMAARIFVFKPLEDEMIAEIDSQKRS